MHTTTKNKPTQADSINSNNTDSKSYVIQKRDGRHVDFDSKRITNAIIAAMRSEQRLPKEAKTPKQITLTAQKISNQVHVHIHNTHLKTKQNQINLIHVEQIQDYVEQQLMQACEFNVARQYILYREKRSKVRILTGQSSKEKSIKIKQDDHTYRDFNAQTLHQKLTQACTGLNDCSPTQLSQDVVSHIFDGISQQDFNNTLIMVARQYIEKEPSYNQVATRLVLDQLYSQVFRPTNNIQSYNFLSALAESNNANESITSSFTNTYQSYFKHYLQDGIDAARIDRSLLKFDLEAISQALKPERDLDFQHLGIQTLYDRYLIHIDQRRIETPQFFWMRVAMGLCLNESQKNRNQRAIDFYNVLSTFRFISATPTLFNAGTPHPQLSSCYLTTVDDDLQHIFKCVQDNAMLSKWAGGLGNDWTRVRATGAHIHGTNGKSQGVIPFLKVANDTALAVNQGGKRKGAVCAYLETWHLDIEAFLDLRKNTGDDRRRTHDMHTAHWIPDLFMQRVEENSPWTLFSPEETPDLHDLYGQAFTKRYLEYEAMADNGQIQQFKRIDAIDLWRKMLSMVFETGHPWLTFKDPSNIRSTQDHAGVIHNSNLCTEILLNTSNDETAVCNLGSLNLKQHTTPKGINHNKLKQTIQIAVRMLDNVIDINYYPTVEAKKANQRHRPIGLGLMGFQDALFIQRMPYDSEDAIAFADQIGEFISYHTILASSQLAYERGPYASYLGSKWDRGLFPIDTIDLLQQARGGTLTQNTSQTLDWGPVRQAVAGHGMRNSHVMAIAPTATISNIAGCFQSIEPAYRNLFVKSNLSGDFTIVNEYLIQDLKQHNLWDQKMLDELKYHDGQLQPIQRIPDEIKQLYQTAFDINPNTLIEATSRRQKWIDMGISFNLYLAQPSGPALSQMYSQCWEKGLKTTYYLRTLAATQIEKSSVDINRHGVQPKWMKNQSASANVITQTPPAPPPPPPPQSRQTQANTTHSKACSILEPDCEACQ